MIFWGGGWVGGWEGCSLYLIPALVEVSHAMKLKRSSGIIYLVTHPYLEKLSTCTFLFFMLLFNDYKHSKETLY